MRARVSTNPRLGLWPVGGWTVWADVYHAQFGRRVIYGHPGCLPFRFLVRICSGAGVCVQRKPARGFAHYGRPLGDENVQYLAIWRYSDLHFDLIAVIALAVIKRFHIENCFHVIFSIIQIHSGSVRFKFVTPYVFQTDWRAWTT